MASKKTSHTPMVAGGEKRGRGRPRKQQPNAAAGNKRALIAGDTGEVGVNTVGVASPKAAKRGRGPGAAVKQGEAGTLIKAYLQSITIPQQRGRKLDVNALRAKRDAAQDPVERLLLTQRLLDAGSGGSLTRAQLEEAFVRHAARWGAERRISFAAWRHLGVSAAVLRRAKIME
jgi:hypothetical protein